MRARRPCSDPVGGEGTRGGGHDPVPLSATCSAGDPRCVRTQALVAQRIEHLTTDQKVGGSSPSERAHETAGQSPIAGSSDFSGVACPESGRRCLRLEV